MNTKYDDEATIYQGAENEAKPSESTDGAKVKSTKGEWKRNAVSAGSALLIGAVATSLMGMKSSMKVSSKPGKENTGDNHKEELSNPEWVDDQVPVATAVNDDMSFGEAFAAARAEVGAGGCFEWRGQLYGTYTADEWNNMTAEERAEYSDHFSWNHIDRSSSDVARNSTHHNGGSHAQTEASDDIDVVSVDHDDHHNDMAQAGGQQSSNQAEVVDVVQPEPEIEILGVVHDSDTGVNYGGMTVDGQEVILIDVDGDMEFDLLATDVNGDGTIDENEFADIQGQGLTVGDLGGISNSGGTMLASNDAPDYSTDAIYES